MPGFGRILFRTDLNRQWICFPRQEDHRLCITALQDFIRSQSADLTEFDETLVRRWFKQITVYEDHYTIELKSGLKVDIDAG